MRQKQHTLRDVKGGTDDLGKILKGTKRSEDRVVDYGRGRGENNRLLMQKSGFNCNTSRIIVAWAGREWITRMMVYRAIRVRFA